MSDATAAQFPRLAYDVMEYALRLKGAPAGREMDAACRRAWDEFQAGRPDGVPVSFDDFRRVFESTITRCTALISRPAA